MQHALRPISLDRVRVTGGFWGERQETNRSRTIPAIYRKLSETGRIDVWELNSERDPRQPRHVVPMFWDSDVAKWIEAAGYSQHTNPDPALERLVDELSDRIAAAQQPDGYLNTYFTAVEPDMRWRNLRDWHEMYNAGHLIEGAVAYYQATGKRTLFDTLTRYADHIGDCFGPNEGQKRGYPGHPELELALVKLYRATGDRRYFDLAAYFIEERGRQPSYFDQEARERGDDPKAFWAKTYHYCQAHAPLREQTAAVGHAVRACYLYAGAADIALETGDTELADVLRTLWDDLTQHQMYVTGGLGPARSNEGFTFAYDLPNETAYAETCASIALAFWAHRMFHLDQDGRYIDVLERALYNTILAGVSVGGDEFFYANPLAAYPNVNPHEHVTVGQPSPYYHRQQWFHCPCCPPNLARIVAGLGEYLYSASNDRLYVHLFSSNVAQFTFEGTSVELTQQTEYPWDGRVQLTVRADQPTEFELALRVPAWCRSYTLDVNGTRQATELTNGYALLRRKWSTGDVVVLTLAMPVERVVAHPDVRQNAGRVALQRGPLIYCLEEADNGPRLANVLIPETSKLRAERDPAMFSGVTTIIGNAVRVEPIDWDGDLYRFQTDVHVSRTAFQFTAIPYFLWANRAPGEMRVWIRSA